MGAMKRQNIIEWLWLIIKYTFVGVAVALVFRGFILIPVPVEGNSMQNTLTQGDYILMEKFSDVKRFDVVVFQMADGTTYIKRVIGLPGDTVSYRNEQLFVNGERVEEDFLKESLAQDEERIPYTNDFEFEELMGVKKLGQGSYFVLGDNRRMSKDSRSFGAISEENILGKAQIVYYPVKRIHFV